MPQLLFRAAPMLLLVGAAYADDATFLKDGLWSIHSVVTQKPSGKTTESTVPMCQSRAYQQRVQESAKGKGTCKDIGKTSTGTTRVAEAE